MLLVFLVSMTGVVMLVLATTQIGEYDDGGHRKTNTEISVSSLGGRCSSGVRAQDDPDEAADSGPGSIIPYTPYPGPGRAMSINNLTAQQMNEMHRALMNKMAPPPNQLSQLMQLQMQTAHQQYSLLCT